MKKAVLRPVLTTLVVLAVLLLVPSASGRGRSDDAAARRWYRLDVHFSGLYRSSADDGHEALTVSSTWKVRTRPFQLEVYKGKASFATYGRGTAQSASFLFVSKGEQCTSKTTRKLVHSVPLEFSWINYPREARSLPNSGFPLDAYRGRTTVHCTVGSAPDYTSTTKSFCPDYTEHTDWDGGFCAVAGVYDSFARSSWAFNDDPGPALRSAFRVASGRLGHDFSREVSLVKSGDLLVGVTSYAIRYLYTFHFDVCPHGGITKKGC